MFQYKLKPEFRKKLKDPDLFEQGMSLVRSCRSRLEQVEHRVAKLMEQGDEAITETLEVDVP